jgi:hypothetical protein
LSVADDAQPEPVAPVDTPYLVTQPDGSTATYTWHTNRPPSVAEVAGYAHSQGQTFAGLPEAAPPPDAAPVAPSMWQRTKNVLFSDRPLLTQAPAIAGAIQGASYGAGLGAMVPPPFDLVTIPVGGVAGAVLGGGGGEALQYGAEKLFGFPAAEPGTLGQRVTSAGVRSGVAEVPVGAVTTVGRVAYRAVEPAAEAARTLESILTGTAETAAPVGTPVAEALSPKYLLPQWFQKYAAGKAPGEIVAAWSRMTPEQQLATAGEQLPAMQDYVTALAKGAVPWSQSVGRLSEAGVAGAPAWWYAGHPAIAASSVLPIARDLGKEALSKGISYALRSPEVGVPWLASLPRAAEIVGPMFNFSSRVAAQPLLAQQWPAAEDLVR